MTEFLLAAAAFVLGTVALGLLRILRGPGEADRILAAQLLGTGGVGALLLFGVASRVTAIADIALVLALLAAFASVGFVAGSAGRNGGAAGTSGDGANGHGPSLTPPSAGGRVRTGARSRRDLEGDPPDGAGRDPT